MAQIKQWLIKDTSRKIIGPYSFEAIKNLIERGLINGDEQISEVPNGAWEPIAKNQDFYDLILDNLEGLSKEKKIASLDLLNDKTAVVNRAEVIEKYKPKSVETPKESSPQDSNENFNPDEFIEKQTKDLNKKAQNNNNTDLFENNLEKKEALQGEDQNTKIAPTAAKILVKIPQIELKAKDENDTIFTNSKPKPKFATNNSGPNPSSSKHIEDQSPNPILLLIVLGLLAIVYVFIDPLNSSSNVDGKIHLIAPSESGSSLTEEELQSLLGRAKALIESDMFTGWLEAQNLLVKIAESNPQNIDVREMICFIYKELWPYAYQDSQDIKTLDQLTASVKNLNPGGTQGRSCQVIQSILTNKFDQALANIDGLLTDAPSSALYAWLKAEILFLEKNYINAQAFASSVNSLWPQFLNTIILQGRCLEKLGQPQEALNAFNEVLKSNPNHKIAKLYIGVIEFDLNNSNENSWIILSSALKQTQEKAPPSIESQAYRVLAEINLLKNETQLAKENIETAYKLNPSDPKIKKIFDELGGNGKIEVSKSKTSELISIGDQYARTGDHFAAQAEYKTAFDLEPTNSTAAIKAAKSLWKINQSIQAIDYLKKAIKAKPSDFSAYVLLSDFYSQRYDFKSAIQILNQAQRYESNSYEIQKGLSLIEFRKNNFIAAAALAEKSLKIYNSDVETYTILAQAQLAMQKVSDAFHSIAKAVEIDPANIDAQIVYGLVLYNYQGYKSAVSYLENLANQSKFILDFKIAIAEINEKEQKFDVSLDIYQKVVQIDSKNKKASVGIGRCFQAMGQMDKALSAFLHAATLDPTDPESLFKAGVLYLETSRFGLAIQQFERVLLVNKNYPLANLFIGRSAFLQGDMQKSMEFANIEKKLNPKLAASYVLAAEIYTATKKYQLCATEYQTALKYQTFGADIYVKLAMCFRLTGTLDVAQSMLDIAASKESGYPEIYKEFGALYFAQGDLTASLKAYDKYLSLSPNAPDRDKVEAIINNMMGAKSK